MFSILTIIVGVQQYLMILIYISLVMEVEHLYMFTGHLDTLFLKWLFKSLTSVYCVVFLFFIDLWESVHSE